ncbi:MAG TPA: methyltransferase domain-containing protein [Stellaceae bacterium]|jgi:2-polyprenyl-3-methyl-5-hydroxy-6-metoxy-1,4-benzoquinol methylase|nr:methyltransferase domain-containing protein [Stellaceae bacterium]
MTKPSSPAAWRAYYTEKRVVHQWTQLDMLGRTDARRVLEIGPAQGLVTAMLTNAGYAVDTLDWAPRDFAAPATRHIEADITALSGTEIAGYDAILCCETLEHIDWDEVPRVLAALRRSGARWLLVSVPYMAFQITFDFYLNAQTLRHYFSMKKLLSRRAFRREPPGGHQWEIGYKDYALACWEARLAESGWHIRQRQFTAHTRSVFHLLEAA